MRGVRSCAEGGEVRSKEAKVITISPISTSFSLAAGICVIYESGSLALPLACAAIMIINSERVHTGEDGFGWDQVKLFLSLICIYTVWWCFLAPWQLISYIFFNVLSKQWTGSQYHKAVWCSDWCHTSPAPLTWNFYEVHTLFQPGSIGIKCYKWLVCWLLLGSLKSLGPVYYTVLQGKMLQMPFPSFCPRPPRVVA